MAYQRDRIIEDRLGAVVPEIPRFFGIVIRMFAELGAPHHAPHFHAYYQNSVGIFTIETIDLIGGNLPRKERRLWSIGLFA
jgi:hypothetical protein